MPVSAWGSAGLPGRGGYLSWGGKAEQEPGGLSGWALTLTPPFHGGLSCQSLLG